MNVLHEAFARASLRLWPALANHLWQATLFAALVLCATLLLRRAPARVRHALWVVASLKFAVPSALFALLAGVASSQSSWLTGAGLDAPLVLQFADPVPTDEIVVRVSSGVGAHNELFCALTLAWAAGVVVLLYAWLRRRRVFLRALRGVRESFVGREFDAMERARARLKLRRDVSLVVAPHDVEPGVWRTRRAVVVLPETIADQLDDEELEALMLHELAHVERRDNLFGNFQTALATVFWFHPMVWFISRRMLAERERACDERVLEAGGAAQVYASSILKVVRFCLGWRVAGVSGASGGSNLRRRIEMILHDNTRRKSSALHRALLCALVVVALALTAWAGLVSHNQTVAALTRVEDDVMQRKPEVAIDAEKHPEEAAVREIMKEPESVVGFENAEGAPAVFNNVKMRLITREQLRRADKESLEHFGGENVNTFVTLPKITLTNISGKSVRGVGVGFATGGKVNAIVEYDLSVEPGDVETLRALWGWHNVIIAGGFGDVTVKLMWVSFDDGTTWGKRVRAPRQSEIPPPPPPAPSGVVGANAVVSSGGGVVVASGKGSGSATGEGGGVGEGEGSGVGKGAGGGVGLREQALSIPNPSYPANAKAARAEGTVKVKITVNEDGNVVAAEAVSGHPLLRSAAVDAARAAKFKPTFIEGMPVKVAGVISYDFVLDEKDDPDRQN